jgi:hypothetical protein
VQNQDSIEEKMFILSQIKQRLGELKEIMMAVTIGHLILINAKPKYEPNMNDDLKNHSNRGSQFRGVSRNGKKWQVSFYFIIHPN